MSSAYVWINLLVRCLKLCKYILYRQKNTKICFHVYTNFMVINLVLISNTAEVFRGVSKH